MKKILIFIITLLIFQPALAETNIDTTVYSTNIWLSKDTFFDGEKIRIYSEFKNNENFDIEETIEFYDNNDFIGEKKIEIASKKSIVVWMDKKLDFGNHRIIAKIKESYKNTLSDTKIKVNLEIKSNLKIIDIDRDTDLDGVGDKKDLDDDNDGFSDTEEIEKGSDPKKKSSIPNLHSSNKNTVAKITTETKNITSSLLEILTEKRESIKKQLEKNLADKKQKKEIGEKKNIIDVNSYNIKSEISLIKKEEIKENFESKKNSKKEIFKNIQNIQNIIKKTNEEIKNIDNQKLSKDERDFSKACLFQAKYEKIEEISKRDINSSWWSKIWLFIIFILSIVFKNNFLTIIFFILLFWLLWKIIKKI